MQPNYLNLMKERKAVNAQTIEAYWLQQKNISLTVLRLDEWHPVVSGNKWFKLQYYLQDAIDKGFDTIATFGGAYSNHIVATAFAGNEMNLKCIGIIRGEESQNLSHTLLQAKEYGMQLQFLSREEYKNKEAIKETFSNVYWINEGGYGKLGAKGMEEIKPYIPDFKTYTHLICAVGTGTTLAGLVKMALPNQAVIGISILKNNFSIEKEVADLLSFEDKQKHYTIQHDYHFGGYAKYKPALIDFINETWQQHHLPLDFVYTAKAFFGLQDMIMNKQTIAAGSRVLFIHTGGLQGNLSLKNVLSF